MSSGKSEKIPEITETLIYTLTFTNDKRIFIPKNVNYIEFGVKFNYDSIVVDEDNGTYKSDGNCLIRRSDNVLYRGCAYSVIPSYVQKIEGSCFSGIKKLGGVLSEKEREREGLQKDGTVNIVLPGNVKELGGYCFNKTGVKEVYLHEGIKELPLSCFSGCKDLKIVELRGVEKIGNACFNESYNIEEMRLPPTGITIEDLGLSTMVGQIGDSMLPVELYRASCASITTKSPHKSYNRGFLQGMTYCDCYNNDDAECLGLKGSSVNDCDIRVEEGLCYVYSFTYHKARSMTEDGEYKRSSVVLDNFDNVLEVIPVMKIPTRKGYRFGGWTKNEGGTESEYPIQKGLYGRSYCITQEDVEKMSDGDTYYAIWIKS